MEEFYTRTLVPPAVVAELERGRSMGIALPDIRTLPWVTIQAPRTQNLPPMASDLGAGEKQVLMLGMQNADAVVILDDRLARLSAKAMQLTFTGTLGIVLRAKAEGRISRIEPLLELLDRSSFHLSPSTRAAVLKQAGESAA